MTKATSAGDNDGDTNPATNSVEDPPEPPLTPMTLAQLLRRIQHEWTSRQRIFDLPSARIWQPDPEIDLSFEFLGRPAATPIGPAAGPHSQMAQNIVLAWLGGSRLFELKTVQVIDDLDIARPCIDMQTIGYNIEWSQELTVAASLEEYVKAAMIIEILRRWKPLAEHLGPETGAHVFDMSVGYDLEGIKTDKVAGFIRAMRDATAEIERLRHEIPPEFAEFADIDFATEISGSVTLSTFHGCPPDEIEAITKHLIDDHGLDVIVKLNPTLLGLDTVSTIVNTQLGYDYVELQPQAFKDDLQFDRAIELIVELNDHAKAAGHKFGIKLTNTLVVSNHKGWMPEDTMYLSGPPLHVLATTLADRLATALPGVLMLPGHDGDVQVSFSAGVSKDNLADTIAMGVQPATICSDLLKPGGYGRLAPMLKALTSEVAGADCTDLTTWRAERLGAATAGGHRDLVAEHVDRITGSDVERYSLTGNSKLPRSVEHELEMWGCVACNFCVTVCPNDAFFKLPTQGIANLEGRQQYLLFSELCNECGNCMTFCPEQGDPAQIKPRLYLDESRFEQASGPRFLLSPASEGPEGQAGAVSAVPADGAAGSLPILLELLNSAEGLPLPLGE